MSMISAADSNKVHEVLANHLDKLEKEIKVPGLQGDMHSVAKKAYKTLVERMNQEKGLNANYVYLTLDAIKGRFYSPFGISNDLNHWIRNQKLEELDDYVWYDLCVRAK